jgi:penicillin-binding protein 1A
MRRLLRPLAVLGLSGAVVPFAVGGTVLASFLYLPLPAALPPTKPAASVVSHLLDASGHEFGQFHAFGENIPVAEQDIPAVLDQAVIASEDRAFYNEGALSLTSTMRAVLANIRGTVQGGSTITQQYAKNAYTSGQRTILRKLQEAILAAQVSRQLPKHEILFRYLSTIYFGEGAYGVGAASQAYFRKPVSQLDASEAAMLAGLIPAPSYYDPLVSTELAEQRRVTVLGLMRDQHYLTPDQYAAAMAEHLIPASQAKYPVPATVFYPPQQPQIAFPYFEDYVRRYLLAKLGPGEVFHGGLRVQTTLDPRVQSAAEATVASKLNGTKPPVDMSLVSVEPATGYVKAVVGGRDFGASQVNLALGGCPARPPPTIQEVVTPTCWDGGTVIGGGGGRQGGSAFKVFTLAAALSKGYLPSRTYPAPDVYQVPHCAGPGCTIHNAEGRGGGPASIASATWASINTVYAQIIRDTGVQDVAEVAKRMGITSALYNPQQFGLSYTLGVIGVSPLDMASAYGTLDNHGLRVEPSPVIKVTDSSGNVLLDNSHPNGDQVVSRPVADNVTDILKGVISQGTGNPNAVLGRPAAGKTGTTEAFHDAWFVGYTPTLSTSVWMGYSDSETKSLTSINGVGQVFGGTIPAQAWHDFMLQALQGVPVTDFSQPPPLIAPPTTQPQGVSQGSQQTPDQTGQGGPYLFEPPNPQAQEPTTTTAPSSSDTTTTTTPRSHSTTTTTGLLPTP